MRQAGCILIEYKKTQQKEGDTCKIAYLHDDRRYVHILKKMNENTYVIISIPAMVILLFYSFKTFLFCGVFFVIYCKNILESVLLYRIISGSVSVLTQIIAAVNILPLSHLTHKKKESHVRILRNKQTKRNHYIVSPGEFQN